MRTHRFGSITEKKNKQGKTVGWMAAYAHPKQPKSKVRHIGTKVIDLDS